MVPDFILPSPGNPQFRFSAVAGRYLVLGFGDAAQLTRIWQNTPGWRDLFDDVRASLFWVAQEGPAGSSLSNHPPGFRVFWDADGAVARLYGASPLEAGAGPLRPRWVVIDPALRVVGVIGMRADDGDLSDLRQLLEAAPPVAQSSGVEMHAPVLCLPNVFEPALCQELIALYEAQDRDLSGFMSMQNGRTVGRHDPRHKLRRDYVVEQPELLATIRDRFKRRVIPQIARAYCFHVTRMERYLVGCYDARDGGHFSAHRDNTTPGTAHRRFAVSVNLNGDFDGGAVGFPEFSARGLKAPPGAAVVFSCSLLHRVGPVTQGRRYAFLPFLYDEPAAALRDANLKREAQLA